MKLFEKKFYGTEAHARLFLCCGRCSFIVALLMIFNCAFAGAAPLRAQKGASSAVEPKEVDEQAFVEFRKWADTYIAAATAEEKTALEARGVELAKARREVMFQFIVFDPQRAFEHAIPMQMRQGLPSLVVAELEKRLSGRSEYAVLAAIYPDAKTGQNKTRIRRSVVLDGTAYNASVYGMRLGVTTKKRIAWHGIALENYIALLDSPLRRIEEGETLAPDAVIGNEKRCPVCGENAFEGIAVDGGGVIYYFDSAEHFQKMEKRIQKREAVIDPAVSGLELLESIAMKRNPEDGDAVDED